MMKIRCLIIGTYLLENSHKPFGNGFCFVFCPTQNSKYQNKEIVKKIKLEIKKIQKFKNSKIQKNKKC